MAIGQQYANSKLSYSDWVILYFLWCLRNRPQCTINFSGLFETHWVGCYCVVWCDKVAMRERGIWAQRIYLLESHMNRLKWKTDPREREMESVLLLSGIWAHPICLHLHGPLASNPHNGVQKWMLIMSLRLKSDSGAKQFEWPYVNELFQAAI